MARLTHNRLGANSNEIEVVDITADTLEGARPLVCLVALRDGQIAAWPFVQNIAGLDTQDVDRLTNAVRETLLYFVRKQG